MKDANFLARHYEKLLITLAFGVLGFTAYKYVLGAPHNATIDNKSLSPSAVDEYILQEHAESLQSRIESKELPPELKEVEKWNLVAPAKDKSGSTVFKKATLSSFFDRPMIDRTEKVEKPPFHQPQVPSPRLRDDLIVAQAYTINPDEFQTTPNAAKRWAELFPNLQPPFDRPIATVVGEFDIRSLIKEFNKPADAVANKAEIPRQWWKDTLGLMDVAFLRQERSPGGQWSNPVPVKIAPNQPFDPSQIPANPDNQVAPQYIKYMRDNQEVIMRPPFPMVRGRAWKKPTEEFIDPNAPKTDDETAKPDEPTAPGTGPIINPVAPGAPAAGPIINPAGNENEVLAKAFFGDVGGEWAKIWIHDMRVQLGKEYRYKLKIGLPNPLFKKPDLVKAQAVGIGKKFLLYSGETEWSKPVQVSNPVGFWAVNAARPDTLVIRVRRFFQGQIKTAEFRIKPGDRIAGVKQMDVVGPDGNLQKLNVVFDTGLHLVDLNFNYRIHGPQGVKTNTVLVTYSSNGQLETRRLDHDKEAAKAWIEEQEKIKAGLAP